MRARRFAAALLAVLVCALPVRAEEDLPGGWEDLPGGGIIWPGDWPPELGEGDPDPVDPVDPSAWADGTVETAGELGAWLQSLSSEGGEIKLGATVTLTESVWPGGGQSGPVVIHTGAYGLVYDGGYIDTTGVQLVGEGVDVPVLEIRSTGDDLFGGLFSAPDWNRVLSDLDVTATGRAGAGGTAVRVTADKARRYGTDRYEARGRIRAAGTGAVGLELAMEEATRAYFLDVDVEGTDALAVSAPEGTTLFGCRLTAQGDGAAAVGAGVLPDTCVLSPEVEWAVRQTVDYQVGIELQLPQGASDADVDFALGQYYDVLRYRLTGGGYLDFCLDWNEGALDVLDTGVLGPVDIPIVLPACMRGLGLEGEDGLFYRVWIRARALPILCDAEQEGDAVTFFTSYEFLESGTTWDSETKLWRSDDGGGNWTDVTGDVKWYPAYNSVKVFQMDAAGLDRPISLVLENKAGWGNVVTLVPGENGVVAVGTGGDRDGGDREEQPGGDGGTHGGGDTGGGLDSPSVRPPKPTPTPEPDPEPEPTPAPELAPESAPAAEPSPEPGPGSALPEEPDGQTAAGDGEAAETPPPAEDVTPPAPAPAEGTPPAREALPAAKPASKPAPLSVPETEAEGKEEPAAPSEPPDPEPPPALAGTETEPPAAGEAPPREAESTPPPAPSAPPGQSSAGGLVLPVLALCAAGGLTALVTLWKRRGDR